MRTPFLITLSVEWLSPISPYSISEQSLPLLISLVSPVYLIGFMRASCQFEYSCRSRKLIIAIAFVELVLTIKKAYLFIYSISSEEESLSSSPYPLSVAFLFLKDLAFSISVSV